MKISIVDVALTGSAIAATGLAYWSAGSEPREATLNLASGYAMSVLFYYLLVAFPEHRKRRRIKANVIAHYLRLKKEILGVILHASGKGWSDSDLERLVKPSAFSAYFHEDESGSGARWYDVLNGLNDHYVTEIATRLELLRSEVQFVLLSINVSDEEVFAFMKRLDEVCFRICKVQADYDGQKSWGRFLWSLYSDFDPAVGHVNEDQNLKMLERL